MLSNLLIYYKCTCMHFSYLSDLESFENAMCVNVVLGADEHGRGWSWRVAVITDRMTAGKSRLIKCK